MNNLLKKRIFSALGLNLLQKDNVSPEDLTVENLVVVYQKDKSEEVKSWIEDRLDCLISNWIKFLNKIPPSTDIFLFVFKKTIKSFKEFWCLSDCDEIVNEINRCEIGFRKQLQPIIEKEILDYKNNAPCGVLLKMLLIKGFSPLFYERLKKRIHLYHFGEIEECINLFVEVTRPRGLEVDSKFSEIKNLLFDKIRNYSNFLSMAKLSENFEMVDSYYGGLTSYGEVVMYFLKEFAFSVDEKLFLLGLQKFLTIEEIIAIAREVDEVETPGQLFTLLKIVYALQQKNKTEEITSLVEVVVDLFYKKGGQILSLPKDMLFFVYEHTTKNNLKDHKEIFSFLIPKIKKEEIIYLLHIIQQEYGPVDGIDLLLDQLKKFTLTLLGIINITKILKEIPLEDQIIKKYQRGWLEKL